jgi:hypothetical protein
MQMKVLIGVLYVFTALAACYWAIYLVLTGLYGVTFSFWSVSLLSGAIVLLAGAIMGWTTAVHWVRWLPVIGGGVIAAYFVPAFMMILIREPALVSRQPIQVLIRAVVAIATLATLYFSLRELLRKFENR